MRAWLIGVLAAGCVSTKTTPCETGEQCPANTECVAITYTDGEVEPTCVSPERRAACADLDDGARCSVGLIDAGTCHEHVCFADTCSNRLVDLGEVCDDGNFVAGDGCSATCVSNETCGNREVDVIRGESCDAGDLLSHDGCSSRCAEETPTWTRLENARPAPRAQSAIVYDVARRRVVMFGGGRAVTLFGDTTEWDGRRWSRTTAVPEPLPRGSHAMAYDAARAQTVMFGGDMGRETWLRDSDGTWSLRTPAVRPPYVQQATMVYDSARQRIVMFGGTGSGSTPTDATWIWNGVTWNQLAPPLRPGPRFSAAMAYDAKRGVVVLFGGTDAAIIDHGDTWELVGDAWVQRQATTAVGTKPAPRRAAAMAYDPIGERVLLVGGQVNGGSNRETWAWDGQAWAQLADANAIAPDTGVIFHSMTTDALRGSVVLVGVHGDVQEWTGSQWTVVDQRLVPDPQMPTRAHHAAALDPLRREVVVFGGAQLDVTNATRGDTWTRNGTWRQEVTPSALTARRGSTLVFDGARREMVMFGGCTAATGAVAETWIWKDGSWSQRFPTVSPPARCFHGSAYHAGLGEVVVFGGTPGGAILEDTWSWDGTTWTHRSGVHPGPRMGVTMAYDPVREEIVLFGGAHNLTVFDDTWTWKGQDWKVVPAVSSPSSRYHSAMAWDAARQRLVMFGGTGVSVASADVWEWDGTDWALLPTARPPLARSRHTLVSNPDGAGVLAIAGQQANPYQSLNEVWLLAWDDRGVQELCTDSDTDGDGRIGALDPDCWWTSTPLCPPLTSCDPAAPHCGDGSCNIDVESCASCPGDCTGCPATCGDFACGAGESMASCPGDCGA